MVGWIEGGAGFFLLAFCLAAPSSYRVDRGRHLASSPFGGVHMFATLSRLGSNKALALFADWTDRIAAGGLSPSRSGRRASSAIS